MKYIIIQDDKIVLSSDKIEEIKAFLKKCPPPLRPSQELYVYKKLKT